MFRMVHKFTNLEGLNISINLNSVIYFEELTIDPRFNTEKVVRIVFGNKDEVYVKDSYEEVMKTFDLIGR